MKLLELQQEILNYYQAKPVEESILSKDAQDDIGIYKSLVILNIENFLQKIFSNTYAILVRDPKGMTTRDPNGMTEKDPSEMTVQNQWRAICTEFLEQFPSKSPIYYKLAENFPQFIASDFFKTKYTVPNYVSELAEFEWSKLEIINSSKTPAYKLLELRFPITKLITLLSEEENIAELQESDIDEENENLLIYRDLASDSAKFLGLNQASLFVIKANGQDIEKIFRDFCKSFNYPEEDEKVKAGFESLIENFKALGIW